MPKYIIKRIAQMIPILFGVILLTFILFNVVGGSPAATVLGKNATAESLEAFDEERGFNKPLLFGNWTTTRAFPDSNNADMTLNSGETVELPVEFKPTVEARWQWHIQYRLTSTDAPATASWKAGETLIALPETEQWQESTLITSSDMFVPAFTVESGQLDVQTIQVRREMTYPWDSQLIHYIKHLFKLDLGYSYINNRSVADLLKQGIFPSLMLTIPIFVGGVVLAIGLALICAWFRDRWPDHLLTVSATVLMSVNYTVWVIVGQFIFAYKLKWFPIWGFESWRYLLLPVFIGIVSGLGREVRLYRTIILDEMYKDYVKTVLSKGLHPAAILIKHVLRNALIPILTNISMIIPFLFTGSLLLESYFGVPGLGGISINAIHASDMDVVRAVVIIGALLYMTVNLITDLLYAWVDPRVRME